MTRDERFIIENAAEGDDLDLLLATHRCADCGDYAFLDVRGPDGSAEWLCPTCADEREVELRGASSGTARAA